MKSSKELNDKQWRVILSYLLTNVQHVQDIEIIEGRHVMLNKLPKDAICAELGVAKGDFSKNMLRITDPKKLHLIDIWGGKMWPYIEEKFKKETELGRVVLHKQKTEEAVENFPDGYFDWIYIDANHTYDFIHKDLEMYRPKMKKGGIIAGHDYWVNRFDGVIKAVNEMIGEPEKVFPDTSWIKNISWLKKENK